MKLMRNSPSTDCFSSDENKSRIDYTTISFEKNSYKGKKYKIDLTHRITDNLRSDPATHCLNKIHGKNVKNRNDQFTMIPKRCKSSLNINKENTQIYCRRKLINFSKEKTSISILNNKSSIILKENSNEKEPHVNEYLNILKIKNNLENNIKEIEAQIKVKLHSLDSSKDSISEHKNENKKIVIIQQRFELQYDYIQKEMRKIKDELIKMNKQTLRELNEYARIDEMVKEEEKLIEKKRNEIDKVKEEIGSIEKEKKILKDNVHVYKKEVEKIKLTLYYNKNLQF